MIVSKAVIVAVSAFALFACARRLPMTPEEELAKFARANGGEWIPAISALQGRNPKLATDSKGLSIEARALVKRLSVSESISAIGEVPDLSHFPSLEQLQLARDGIDDIGRLAGLRLIRLSIAENKIVSIDPLAASCEKLEYLQLGFNPIKDLRALQLCDKLRELDLSRTQVERLPDLSGLKHLRRLSLGATPIESLANIETIPSDFDLNMIQTKNLKDIEPLLRARVNTLYIDEDETYPRFRSWFDRHMAEIKSKRPRFNIQFMFAE